MSRRIASHIISILFITLMLFKGVASLTPLFSVADAMTISELLMDMEREQENKETKMVESGFAEDIYEAATALNWPLSLLNTGNKQTNGMASPLHDGYLDTLTPPPNSRYC